MAAGGWIEGGVLVAFGAGFAYGRRRLWATGERTARASLVIRAAIPVFLGATAVSSAAGAPTGLSAVLLSAFVVCVLVAVGLGASIRLQARRLKRSGSDPGPG